MFYVQTFSFSWGPVMGQKLFFEWQMVLYCSMALLQNLRGLGCNSHLKSCQRLHTSTDASSIIGSARPYAQALGPLVLQPESTATLPLALGPTQNWQPSILPEMGQAVFPSAVHALSKPKTSVVSFLVSGDTKHSNWSCPLEEMFGIF